jgi:hypothetical protein
VVQTLQSRITLAIPPIPPGTYTIKTTVVGVNDSFTSSSKELVVLPTIGLDVKTNNPQLYQGQYVGNFTLTNIGNVEGVLYAYAIHPFEKISILNVTIPTYPIRLPITLAINQSKTISYDVVTQSLAKGVYNATVKFVIAAR